MSDVMHATMREGLGTRAARRLRQEGHIPAVLYGHGEETMSLSVPTTEVEAVIRHGSKLIALEGAVTDSALIKDVQWDAFGHDVLHLDLTRVSAEEAVDVVVTIELVGEAPGVKQGGMVDHVTHEVEIRCPAGLIPERFEVKINSLQLGDSITLSSLELPEGAELLSEAEKVIAACEEMAAEVEEEVEGETVEPEVIGRKEGEESEG